MIFEIKSTDNETSARSGVIHTAHGKINTPVFMPVGTLASVKAVHQHELAKDIKAEIILGNTYHLYLRPGIDTITKAGGLHGFMNWKGPILTDSGGYQVFSLADQRLLTEEGAIFQSHIDGSKHNFTPESVVDIQRQIGADIIMALDECTPFPCEYDYAKSSMELTHRWLERGVKQYMNTDPVHNYEQYLFPIVQGSVYPDLRVRSAEKVASFNLPGNAIGGLSVGEPEEDMYKMVGVVNRILPEDKPRYLMGVGSPVNLLENIALGIDMFDCVMPTRNGRNGHLFTSQGIINIKNEKWKEDFSPIDPDDITYVDTQYSRAYLRHLIMSRESLGAQIASLHNLGFYVWLMSKAREQIGKGTFGKWKNKMVKQLAERL
ncbi:MAG: tRNA guanosine(34) transglycosylase Tgt [Bacteroidales bacterium]|nr:tRNA guanosine(34) transglycosylase Tgt [Bacteroidales bacterium]